MPEAPPVLLAVGGLDPSGGAGLAIDARAAAGAGVFARLVASALTVQDSRRLARVSSVDPSLLAASLDAAFAEGVDVVKAGLLHDARTVDVLLDRLPHDVPLVVDPVLRATSGGELVAQDALAAYPRLLARTTLATPNADEARRLTGLPDARDAAWALRKLGARNVLVTGGDVPGARVVDLLVTEAEGEIRLEAPRLPGGPWRGTGCALATLAGAHMAQGYSVFDAVEAAVAQTRDAIRRGFAQPGAAVLPGFRSLLPDARGYAGEAKARIARVASAWRVLLPLLERQDVPEVGANLSFLPADGNIARSAGLSARCVRTGTGVTIAGRVELGGIHHTARIAAAAHAHDPRIRAAMNLRFREDLVAAARSAGLCAASFRREAQPPEERSTVAWGTRVAIEEARGVPDVIYDSGGVGKEAMMRILGADPEDVVAKVMALLRALPSREHLQRARTES